jgi:hypothetical protein
MVRSVAEAVMLEAIDEVDPRSMFAEAKFRELRGGLHVMVKICLTRYWSLAILCNEHSN